MTNYFPQYMPTYQQPAQTGLNWVQGESGAKSYLVAPGNTVMLMDSEGSKFYLKSADNAGMPTLRVFEYKECTKTSPQAPQAVQSDLSNEYVTREEYSLLQGKIEDILKRFDEPKKTEKIERVRKAVENDD